MFNMSVKSESPLNLDTEIKIKIENDDHKDGTESKDKKPEIENIVIAELVHNNFLVPKYFNI